MNTYKHFCRNTWLTWQNSKNDNISLRLARGLWRQISSNFVILLCSDQTLDQHRAREMCQGSDSDIINGSIGLAANTYSEIKMMGDNNNNNNNNNNNFFSSYGGASPHCSCMNGSRRVRWDLLQYEMQSSNIFDIPYLSCHSRGKG